MGSITIICDAASLFSMIKYYPIIDIINNFDIIDIDP